MAKSTFENIVIDAEADGLFNYVTGSFPTVVHCSVIKDIDTNGLLAFIPKEFITDKVKAQVDVLPLEELPKYLNQAKRLIGHNLITYDLPLFKEVLGVEIPLKKVTDTLIMSQIAAPQRKGGHGLEAWGKRVKRFKPDHKDWSKFSYKMLVRCIEDVHINHKVLTILENDLKTFEPFSIRLEHKVRQLMHDQEVRGCPLDEAKAHKLMIEIKDRAEDLKREILKDFKPRSKLVREVTPKYKKVRNWTGEYELSSKGRKVKVWEEKEELSSVGLRAFSEDEIHNEVIGGPFSLFTIDEFNLASPTQIVERMNEAGWRPIMFTDKGAPKVCEENLATLPDDAPQSAKNLALWKMCESRWKLFESYLDNTDVNGNIHGSVNPLGTRTMRMAHSSPNLGNVPSKKSPYGQEARECFTVGDLENEVMVGADASGIQLRGLAHYINSPKYTEMVCGPDIHAEHGYLLEFIRRGENDHELFEAGRSQAKTFIYSWLFGAGDFKLGHSLGGGRDLGKEKKRLFYERVDGLEEFMKGKMKAALRGYMEGIDGRKYKIPSDHLALPCYLQGFEQVIMKYAMVLYHNKLNKMKIPFRQVLMVHDEFEAITHKDYGDIVGQTMVESIIEAGEYFNTNCPLDGEYKIGLNWYEVH